MEKDENIINSFLAADIYSCREMGYTTIVLLARLPKFTIFIFLPFTI